MSDPDRFPVYEPRDDQPPRPASAGHLLGRADGSTTRVESHGRDVGSETVLSFRLLGPDGGSPREVQLRGRSISGTVRDGDWVEVGARERAGRLEVDRLRNLTTGADVTVSGSSTSAGARIFKVVFVAVFVAILLLAVAVMLSMVGVIDDGWLFGDGGALGGALRRAGLDGPAG